MSATSKIDYLKFNGKITRFNGTSWRIIAQRLGPKVLVTAECFFGPDKGKEIQVVGDKSSAAQSIRSNLRLGLVS